MRLLFIAPYFYAPENKDGTRKILFNLFQRLPEGVHVDYVFLENGECTEEKLHRNNVFAFKATTELSPKYIDFLTKPLEMLKYDLRSISIVANRLYREKEHDVVVVVGAAFAEIFDYLDYAMHSKVVLMSIDSMSLFWSRRAVRNCALINKIGSYLQERLWKKIEKEYYGKYKYVLFVSDVDCSVVTKNAMLTNGIVINNGIDVCKFYLDKNVDEVKNSAIFTGNMDYYPNKMAARLLIKEYFPMIKREIPDFKLYLVGKGASKIDSDYYDIDCIDYVEDLNKYLCKCLVYISPLFHGSGFKNKIIEAFASGRIVVGTSVSFEGIEGFVSNNDYFCADDVKSLVELTIKALRLDGRVIDEIRNRTRATVEKSYTWESVAQQYLELFGKVVGI